MTLLERMFPFVCQELTFSQGCAWKPKVGLMPTLIRAERVAALTMDPDRRESRGALISPAPRRKTRRPTLSATPLPGTRSPEAWQRPRGAHAGRQRKRRDRPDLQQTRAAAIAKHISRRSYECKTWVAPRRVGTDRRCAGCLHSRRQRLPRRFEVHNALTYRRRSLDGN